MVYKKAKVTDVCTERMAEKLLTVALPLRNLPYLYHRDIKIIL